MALAAHMWRNLATSRQTGENHESSVQARVALKSFMPPEDLSEAQRLATEWDERTRVREPSVFLRKVASPRGIALM